MCPARLRRAVAKKLNVWQSSLTYRVLLVCCECCIHVLKFLLPDAISTFRTAIDALLQSGHQPSRTLVLTLMLGNVHQFPLSKDCTV